MSSLISRALRRPRAILKYQKEHTILVKNIHACIGILYRIPEGNYLVEVALNIQSLKIQADKVKWASQALAIEAADMPFVTSKGVDHFSCFIPRFCDYIGSETTRLAETLQDHIHKPVPKTEHGIQFEMLIATDLQSVLAKMGTIGM
ncbi:hypothetical protein N7516_011140 [Penicillium verrucosum]|uniref:uncharacterized protein n=1 Tax=Penicillium verrucosum TaxID=60171 RepID=UPI00254528F0|nr:uncharacterized protein N7516_011140 [Penicillium verrucosum]KAJ5920282.1 hypothetical protein N7516_011140 [Penicillium verrucosum]